MIYPDILAFGEPLFEFSQVKQAQVNREPDFLSGFGGDASNFAITAARQGASVGVLTAVGTDNFGHKFLELWQKEGVKTQSVIRDNKSNTGVYFITHGMNGHEFTFLRKGSAASKYSSDQLPIDAFKNIKLLHVTAITQAISEESCDAVFSAIALAKENNVVVTYDTNLRLKLWGLERAKAIIEQTAKLVDIIFPSLDEARLLTELETPEAIVEHYLELGAKVVVLKMGEEGAIVATSKERHKVSAMETSVVDATAAGDSFAGSFITHYIAGKSLLECLKFANCTASITVSNYGAVDALPTLNQVKTKLERYFSE